MATEDHIKAIAAVLPWTASGVLPPVDASDPTSPDRSPYVVTLAEYVQRFGSTPERRLIIDGLLRYRAALHAAGFKAGFQWLNGSFVENVELIEGRPPNDIDVVTFSRPPKAKHKHDLDVLVEALFNPESTVSAYCVDGYFVDLTTAPKALTTASTYWYSVWSHRRDLSWKGFIQIDLAPTNGDILQTQPRKSRRTRNEGRR